MVASDLLLAILIILSAAFVGGLFARSVKLPEIFGYLIAGIMLPVVAPGN